MSTTSLPAPPDERDVIRVPRQLGLAAMSILGTRAGAVVEDPAASALYFFVPAGTASAWDVQNTRAVGDGERVPVPPMRRTSGPGPHWRMCPGDDGWYTDPAALSAAIGDAFGPRLGEEFVS
ncbi:hypothetical protein [Streptomyces olivaceus]|uniref:hypothetical protein n=1 Tax=Streptomyces olivaceus TaxID=47716 RepID=UPI0022EEE0EA|nr:hypothetical protein [Streptomyces olivaceus]GHI91760.1 hypothetical protein TPA0905_12310 [Streptomyces olivaceus]